MSKELNYLNRINQAFSDVSGFYESLVKEIGLSYPEFLILYKLFTESDLTQRNISVQHHIPKQTVNHVIKKFVESGYIVLVHKESNSKEKVIQLTEKGLTLVLQKIEPIIRIEEEVIRRMGFETADQLINITIIYASLFDAIRKEFKHESN